jgi:hypothetical protein
LALLICDGNKTVALEIKIIVTGVNLVHKLLHETDKTEQSVLFGIR